MAVWIVLGIILLLILLIFFVPYGIDVLYSDNSLRISVKAGPILIKILPKKPLTEKQKLKKEKKKAEKAEKKAAEKTNEIIDDTIKVKAKKKIDCEFLFQFLKMGLHAIKRVFRSFTFHILKLYYCAGTADPYDTSVQYGYACALAEAIPEMCNECIRIENKDVVIDADYTADSPTIEAHVSFTLQLFKIVHAGVLFGVEFLKWKLKKLKEKKNDRKEGAENHGRE